MTTRVAPSGSASGRTGLPLACASLVLALGACNGTPAPAEDPRVWFRAAVIGAPGGALLSVWGDARSQRAFLVGGFVGVDPASVPGGTAGRLVEYRWPGRFITRCTADSALWWVSGVENAAGALELWAVGDRARVLRMRGDRCEPVATGLPSTGGEPTFWGVLARSPDDIWIVGGSARPDGPHGVLLHGDGTSWRQEPIPESAASENLYKVTADGDVLYVVGSGGLILRRGAGDGVWRRIDVQLPTSDHRLFTVSCAGGACFAVGGSASGLLLTGGDQGWRALSTVGDASLETLPPLSGVWARGADDVLMVGANGATLHLGGGGIRRPLRSLTSATLHGVGGFGEVVIAVGGELSNATTSQRAVILVQHDDAPDITLDGRTYVAGAVQGSRPGAGQ